MITSLFLDGKSENGLLWWARDYPASFHDTPRPSERSHMLLNERTELVGKGGW